MPEDYRDQIPEDRCRCLLGLTSAFDHADIMATLRFLTGCGGKTPDFPDPGPDFTCRSDPPELWRSVVAIWIPPIRSLGVPTTVAGRALRSVTPH